MTRSAYFSFFILFFYFPAVFAATFSYAPLSNEMKDELIKSQTWRPDCPVPLDRLNRLTVTYYDFAGQEQIGHLIVFDAAAPYVLTAFKKMYAIHYPLEKVGENEANPDEETSAFICRDIRGESKYSLHAYGLAIDINILRNPYLGDFTQSNSNNLVGTLIPSSPISYSYLNRSVVRPGMNEKIVSILAKSGFIIWGGQWQDRVDYQHFQVPNNMAINLAYLDKKSAEKLMQLIIAHPESAKKMSADSKWQYLYELYPKNYIDALSTYFYLLDSKSENTVFNLVYQKLSSG